MLRVEEPALRGRKEPALRGRELQLVLLLLKTRSSLEGEYNDGTLQEGLRVEEPALCGLEEPALRGRVEEPALRGREEQFVLIGFATSSSLDAECNDGMLHHVLFLDGVRRWSPRMLEESFVKPFAPCLRSLSLDVAIPNMASGNSGAISWEWKMGKT